MATACSGTADKPVQSTRSPGSSPIAVATTATSTTIATTVPPGATTAPAETTTTTPASTTADPRAALEAEVRAAHAEISRVGFACNADPATCDFSAVLVDPLLTTARTNFERNYLILGRRAERNSGDPSYISIDGPIEISIDGLSASFVSCFWDTGILVNTDPYEIVNDLHQSSRNRQTLRKVDGRWYATSSEPVGPAVVGRNDCGPRP